MDTKDSARPETPKPGITGYNPDLSALVEEHTNAAATSTQRGGSATQSPSRRAGRQGVSRELPILFSSPMVRALLAGTKTQTRRVVKPQPWASCCIEEGMAGESPFVYSALGGDGPGYDVHESRTPCRCPYGEPGDRLWVRETWNTSERCLPRIAEPYIYAADIGPTGKMRWAANWRPSIHMPRAASRITLEITGVRVERLQDISEADATAEGIGRYDNGTFGLDDPSACMGPSAVVAYMRLWNHINGPGSWDVNPWVWVLEFRTLERQ